MRPISLVAAVAAVGLGAARAHDVHALQHRRASQAILERKGLRRAGIHTIYAKNIPCNTQSSCRIDIVDGDVTITVELERHSVLSKDFRVLVQRKEGLVEVLPGREGTFRGRIVGDEGSAVAASVTEHGVTMEIVASDGDTVNVEPVDGADVALGGGRRLAEEEGDHVVYRQEDVVARQGKACGMEDDEGEHDHLYHHNHHNKSLRHLQKEPRNFFYAVTPVKRAQISIDADYEFYTRHNSDVNLAVNQIVSVFNAVNSQYERDVGITHEINNIIMRATAEDDPYTATDSTALLKQVKEEWEANHKGTQRDLVQLFTGKDLDGQKGGNAWRSTICTDYHYSVVEHRDIWRDATAVSAHELGHSWGASHLWDPNFTMFGGLIKGYGANLFHPFLTVPTILERRDMEHVTCLDVLECTHNMHCSGGARCDQNTNACVLASSTATNDPAETSDPAASDPETGNSIETSGNSTSKSPSQSPTASPDTSTNSPSKSPTANPSERPSVSPTVSPGQSPSNNVTASSPPSTSPTVIPEIATSGPSISPTDGQATSSISDISASEGSAGNLLVRLVVGMAAVLLL